MPPPTNEMINLLSDPEDDDSIVLPSHRWNEVIAISDDENDHPPPESSSIKHRHAIFDPANNETNKDRNIEDGVHTQQTCTTPAPALNQPAPLTVSEALVQLMVLFPDIEYQYAVDVFRNYVRAQQLPGNQGVVDLEAIIELIAQKESYPAEGARRRALKRKREEEEKDPHNFRQWTRDDRELPTPEYLHFV
jgi:hypothetical protein